MHTVLSTQVWGDNATPPDPLLCYCYVLMTLEPDEIAGVCRAWSHAAEEQCILGAGRFHAVLCSDYSCGSAGEMAKMISLAPCCHGRLPL